ncbi:MAG TPA: fibronectin type III domain-containing protein [Gemmataceae bacterium]|jgi:hypothetical protein
MTSAFRSFLSSCVLLGVLAVPFLSAAPPELSRQEANTWVKRSPLPDGPVSPRLGYESSLGYDPRAHVLIRWGGHNQGGGGEQNAETWTFDPRTARWTLKEPNDAPPGVCCAQQNVFDPIRNRFLRFPAFSGSHGWQWFREIYLKNSSVWAYDLASNTWRDLRPLPEPHLGPLRCASWDTDHEVLVVFGGEGSHEGTLVYDPYANTWTKRHAPDQPAFRSGGNLAYDAARKLHILFGSQFNNDTHTWSYDLRGNRWRDFKPATQPPTDRNDAVLAYDSVNRVIVAVIKITEGEGEKARHRLETWSYDAGRNTWTKMDPPRDPDASGNRARLMTFVPDLGLTFLETRTHPPQGPAEQQIWTYCYARPKPQANAPPEPPTDLRLSTEKGGARLSWKASPSANSARYIVYRGEGAAPWEVTYQEVGRVGAKERTFHDTGLRAGRLYFYTVRAADADGKVGAESTKARTQPRVVEEAVVSVLSPREVELTWTPMAGEDVIGYHVERATVEVWSVDQLQRLKKRTPPLAEPVVGSLHRIGAFQRITPEPLKEPHFKDAIDLEKTGPVKGEPIWERRFAAEHLDAKGKPYSRAVFAYRIRAINRLGIESGPSPFFLTLPSAPAWLFSRERGTKCELKWARNPEKGLRGYRVYRLDGRFDNQPVSRLTPEPITDLTFTDAMAGKSGRRYHVVAVDALGQEGLPSAPVWFEREWKPFYKPFVGEWHQ